MRCVKELAVATEGSQPAADQQPVCRCLALACGVKLNMMSARTCTQVGLAVEPDSDKMTAISIKPSLASGDQACNCWT